MHKLHTFGALFISVTAMAQAPDIGDFPAGAAGLEDAALAAFVTGHTIEFDMANGNHIALQFAEGGRVFMTGRAIDVRRLQQFSGIWHLAGSAICMDFLAVGWKAGCAEVRESAGRFFMRHLNGEVVALAPRT